MKTLKSLRLAALITLGMCGTAFAGDRVGNGGITLVCETNNQIEKVVLYDLAEGFTFNNDESLHDDGRTVDEYLSMAQDKMAKYNPYLGVMLKAEIEKVRSQDIWQIGRYAVELTPDTRTYGFNIRVCNDPLKDPKVLQVANYMDNINKLRIDEKLFNNMTPLNQAALIVHETIYKLERSVFGAQKSDRARRMTSLIFSDDNSNEAERDGHFKIYYDAIFLGPILNGNNRFLNDWNTAPNYDVAKTMISSRNELTLAYGIKYNLGYTVDNLPLYANGLMELQRRVQHENKMFNGEDVGFKMFMMPPATALVGGAGVGLATAAGTLLLPAVTTFSVVALTSGAFMVGAAAGVTYLVFDIIKDEIRYKQVLNSIALIKSSEECVKQDKCQNTKLIKFYNRFAKENSSVTVKEYATKVIELSKKGSFFIDRKKRSKRAPFATVKQMNKIILSSF